MKNVHSMIRFNEGKRLKMKWNGMNTELRQKAKNNFEKIFFKLINNAIFWKTMENVRRHRNIKLVTTERTRNNLVSEPNYHTTKFFTENLLAIEIKKLKQLWKSLFV